MNKSKVLDKNQTPHFYNTRQNKNSRSPQKEEPKVIKKKFQPKIVCKPSNFSYSSKTTQNTFIVQKSSNQIPITATAVQSEFALSLTKSISHVLIHSSSDGKDRSKDASHYVHRIGEVIQKKYQIVKLLGDGTFGRVFEVRQIHNNKVYALKMVRAVERFVDAAILEAQIVEKFTENQSLLQIIEHFQMEQNYCLVFERLGDSLYDFLKQNNFRGYPIEYVQSFFQQILQQLDNFHQMGLTHTDLKPENILIKSKSKIPYKNLYNKNQILTTKDDSCYFLNDPNILQKKFYVPRCPQIKIVDFGGATWDYEHHSSIINTRQYRAPEVMIQNSTWNQKSDIWGVACVIVELYSGKLLFDTHNTYEHLALIQEVSGVIPQNLLDCLKDDVQEFFIKKQLIWPDNADQQQKQKVTQQKKIEQIISSDHKELQDLLKQMLVSYFNEEY